MASAVYTTENINLQDESVVVLKPLNIKALRKFMAKMGEFEKLESANEEDGLNILLDAAAICLMAGRPEFWDETKNSGRGGATDIVEEVMDMPTIYKVLDVCGGVKLNDPNLVAAATATLGEI